MAYLDTLRAGIQQGSIIQASHVTELYDALSGTGSLGISVIGSSTIGTTTPNAGARLTVNGNMHIMDGDIQLSSAEDISWGGAWTANAPTIAAVSGSNSRIVFYSAGQSTPTPFIMTGSGFGIGTINPTQRLHVAGGSVIADNYLYNGKTATAQVLHSSYISHPIGIPLSTSSFTDICYVYNDATSLTRFTFKGGGGDSVISVIADVIVNHEKDVYVQTQGGAYDALQLRIKPLASGSSTGQTAGEYVLQVKQEYASTNFNRLNVTATTEPASILLFSGSFNGDAFIYSQHVHNHICYPGMHISSTDGDDPTSEGMFGVSRRISIGATSSYDHLDSRSWNLWVKGKANENLMLITGSTAGNRRFHIDSIGRVGIGTNPYIVGGFHTLTVGANELPSAGLIKLRSTYNNGDGAEIYQDPSNGTITFNSNSSLSALYLTTGSGGASRVGIGTSLPTQRLDVGGSVTADNYYFNSVPGATAQAIFKSPNPDGPGNPGIFVTTSSFTDICYVEGGATNIVRFGFDGGGNDAVVSGIADIIVNHNRDVYVQTQGGAYNPFQLRIKPIFSVSGSLSGSSTQGTYVLQFKLGVSYASATGRLYVNAVPLDSNTTVSYTIPSGLSYSDIQHTHICRPGMHISAVDGDGGSIENAKLNIQGGIAIASGLSNASARPALNSYYLNNGEIRGYSSALDVQGNDGFLRLSAGGGTNTNTKAYIDISGYSNVPDMDSNIVFGTAGSERMRILNNGRVGIGTDDPQSMFHINATATPSTGEQLMRFTVSDDTSANLIISNGTGTNGVFSPTISGKNSSAAEQLSLNAESGTDSGTFPAMRFSARSASNEELLTKPLFAWYNYGTEKMRMTAAGSVGIGTIYPSASLHVQTPAAGAETIARFGISDDMDSYFEFVNGTGTVGAMLPTLYGHSKGSQIASYFVASSDDDTGTAPIMSFMAHSGSIGTYTDIQNRPLFEWRSKQYKFMQMTPSGYLGIGQEISTIPARLTVKGSEVGTTLSDWKLSAQFENATPNVNKLIIGTVRTTNGGTDHTTTGTRIQQQIDSTYQAYIQFGGSNAQSGIEFGVGAGTPGGSIPIPQPAAMTIDAIGRVGIGKLPTSTLDVNGTVTCTGFSNTSDIRLKENIEEADYETCYNIINSLPLKRYSWRQEVFDSMRDAIDRNKIGWIAQDVETVFPHAIHTGSFFGSGSFTSGSSFISGSFVSGSYDGFYIEDAKYVNFDQIYAAMYGTIKYLIAENNELKTQVSASNADIAAIKSHLGL